MRIIFFATEPIYVRIGGEWKHVYREVDENMEPIDIYVSKHRDKKTSKEFFKNCIRIVGFMPESIRSDSHKGYNQVKSLFPK